MWKDAFTAMAIANVESLAAYRQSELPEKEITDDLSQFVCGTLLRLPWYFRLPLEALGIVFELVCRATTGRRSANLDADQRAVWRCRLGRIPLLRTASQTVRALALVRLFDHVPNPSSLHSSIPHTGES